MINNYLPYDEKIAEEMKEDLKKHINAIYGASSPIAKTVGVEHVGEGIQVTLSTKDIQKILNLAAYEYSQALHGCGYWAVCDDHACPCHPTAKVSKGYDADTYENMRKDFVQIMSEIS
jgi:hypothetical protein